MLKELKHWQLMPVAVAITVITGETSISFGFSVGATGHVFSSLTPRDHPLALTLAARFLLTAVPIALLPVLPSVKIFLKTFPSYMQYWCLYDLNFGTSVPESFSVSSFFTIFLCQYFSFGALFFYV